MPFPTPPIPNEIIRTQSAKFPGLDKLFSQNNKLNHIKVPIAGTFDETLKKVKRGRYYHYSMLLMLAVVFRVKLDF